MLSPIRPLRVNDAIQCANVASSGLQIPRGAPPMAVTTRLVEPAIASVVVALAAALATWWLVGDRQGSRPTGLAPLG